MVVWQPPTNPNGIITGYQVRYAGGAPSTLPATTTYSVASENQRTSNVQIQVITQQLITGFLIYSIFNSLPDILTLLSLV